MLRDQAGCIEETLETNATTLRDLYLEAQARHGLTLPPDRIGMAVNDELTSLDREFADADSIAFMPPVCGG
jgi:molybdopterin converting factor small subunit